jgi:hypothetical protein
VTVALHACVGRPVGGDWEYRLWIDHRWIAKENP